MKPAPFEYYAPASLDEALVRQARLEGLQVIPWTVNAPADMQRLVGWGVDGLITDEPDRASVRDFARARLSSPVSALGEIAHNWRLAG